MKIEDLNHAKELDKEENSATVGGWTLFGYSSSTTSTSFGKISDGSSNTFSYFKSFAFADGSTRF